MWNRLQGIVEGQGVRTSASMHPQRAAALCLHRLELSDGAPGTLTLRIKGPVFYDTAVSLVAVREPNRCEFGLSLAGDPRPAIVDA